MLNHLGMVQTAESLDATFYRPADKKNPRYHKARTFGILLIAPD